MIQGYCFSQSNYTIAVMCLKRYTDTKIYQVKDFFKL